MSLETLREAEHQYRVRTARPCIQSGARTVLQSLTRNQGTQRISRSVYFQDLGTLKLVKQILALISGSAMRGRGHALANPEQVDVSPRQQIRNLIIINFYVR